MADSEEPQFLHEFFRYWGLATDRDHPHHRPENWIDEPAQNGWIKTRCKICGGFIGRRPAKMTRVARGPD